MADFEELKLTVNLVDNASAGLGNIRTQLTQLMQTAGQVQTAFSGVATSTQQVGNAAQQAAPKVSSQEKALKELTRSAEETGRGLVQMALASRRGTEAWAEMALSTREAFTGLKGASVAMGELGVASRAMVVGLGSVALGIGAVGAAVAAYGISVFRFSQEMFTLSQTAKSLGMTLGTLRNVTEQNERFGISVNQTVAQLGQMNEALTDLTLSGSQLRQQLLSQGVPAQWIDDYTKLTNAVDQYNKVREGQIKIHDDWLKRSGSEQVASTIANRFGKPFGIQDAWTRPAMEQPTKEELARDVEIAKQSALIAEQWRQIAKTIGDIKTEFLGWGLPGVVEVVRGMNEGLKVTVGLFESIGHQIEAIKGLMPEWFKNLLGKAWALEKGALGGLITGGPIGALRGGYGALQGDHPTAGAAPAAPPAAPPAEEGGMSGLYKYSPMSYRGANDNVHPLLQNASFGSPGADVSGRAGMPGGAPNGSDTGPATGNRAPGAVGDPAVPSHILDQAKAVALHSGPGGVEAFMREQGYPKAGNWCGEFAASVVKSAGGTPPQNPAIASNWRNWGSPVEGAPQPGDVAVRKGVRTGSTGSHVTFVENFDPKTGRFTGVGGNQGSAESSFKAGQYEFRRGGNVDLGAVAKSAGVAGAAGGSGTGAVGEGAQAYLAAKRAPFAKELEEHPETRKLLGAVTSSENPGAGPAVAESLMNRTELVNAARAKKGLAPLTLHDMITGHGGKSFYGPVRSGAINEHLAKMNDPTYAAKMNALTNQALGGSDTIKSFTDQGSKGDPNYEAGGVGVNINRERFNDWGYPGSGAWRQQREAELAAADRGALNPPDRAALSKPQEINSTGNLSVDVKAPAGTKVAYHGQNLLKNTSMQRQTQMMPTSSGPTVADSAQSYMRGGT